MNILFEIADRDLILFGFILTTVILLGIIIFWAVNKGKIVLTEEVIEEPKLEKPELTEEQKAAKAELERVFNQMSADLEAKTPRQAEIDAFEKEQEENAIISYQELMRQATTKDTEPINSIIEKEEPKKNIQLEIEVEKDEEEPKKFKNSEIISPIFGIQNKDKIQYKNKIQNKEKIQKPKPEYREPEQPIIAKHAYDEIKQNFEEENNRDFLNSLKEFRKNL